VESSVDLKKLSRDAIDRAMGRIALMKFFPASDISARATVMLELIEMCSTDEQVEWLGNRVTALYTEWPGLRELRAVFCSKFKPADGIEVYSADTRFIDGIPSERQISEGQESVPGRLTPGTRLQIAGKVEKMPEADLEQLHNETIGALLESTAPMQPGRRDWIAAKRLAAILDGNGEEATKLTAQLAAMNPRTAEERDAIKAAEREIAEAKPTLTAEEKARRIAEIENAIGKKSA
jgi:hypothetical protein